MLKQLFLLLYEPIVLTPFYNEKDNIGELVVMLLSLPFKIHVVIIDDNSPDGTGQLADDLRTKHDRLHIIHRNRKMGLGTAHITGFKYALKKDAKFIFTMDADLSHHPTHIPSMLHLASQCYVVFGSRYVPGGGIINWGLSRRFLSWVANHLSRAVLGLQVRDCTTGFRCYHREVLLNIDLDNIFSGGYSFLIEMAYICQKMGYTIGEVPIIFANRTRGTSKISKKEIFKAMYTLTRLSFIRPFTSSVKKNR